MSDTSPSDWPGSNVEMWELDRLIPYARNARTHSESQVQQIAASMVEFGWTNPVLADERGGIIAGHGRVMGARLLGWKRGPVIVARGWSEAKKRAYILADNKLALNAGWDEELLKLELLDLQQAGFDMKLTGFDDIEISDLLGSAGGGIGNLQTTGSLADKFMVAPFSVLNAREGWWQARKSGWIALGIKSERGRTTNALDMSASLAGITDPEKIKEWNAKRRKAKGRTSAIQLPLDKGRQADGGGMAATSVFDPVLCELAYRWFSPPGGIVIDPFAGGSVRGIVASKLNRGYFGVDLRPEQVAANNEQRHIVGKLKQIGRGKSPRFICADDCAPVHWHVGDSADIKQAYADSPFADRGADFLFSCPPYVDLERYSDDPRDLSAMGWPAFRDRYALIISESCDLLKNDRFACFVVGEVRAKGGAYYNFVGETVAAFQAAGLHFYNEAILVTAVGTLSLRASKQFSISRKLGKTHQNVLVFVKGDPRKAAEACGTVEVDENMLNSIAAEAGVAAD